MTSKEALEQFLSDFLMKCIELDDNDDMYYKNNLTSPYHIIKKDLEILEIFKRILVELVFNDDPYCNLVITDIDNCIDVDYDSKAPDVEMTNEEYEKVRKFLKK